MTVVYDAGALIAADRNSRTFLAIHAALLGRGLVPVVPAGVVAQVWRSPDRQVPLVRVLRGCRVEPLDEIAAKRVGLRAGASGVSDVIDCTVADAALRLGCPVLTSDPVDIARAGVPAAMIRVC